MVGVTQPAKLISSAAGVDMLVWPEAAQLCKVSIVARSFLSSLGHIGLVNDLVPFSTTHIQPDDQIWLWRPGRLSDKMPLLYHKQVDSHT